ncbi:MAG: 16S rRNA (guanine(527)-N(7))-methyltransferase RsmG [Gammaproteobacteria bacterium]|nr:16S rRNA (guanine(527)-N(7))-methyltransferase RsmG [Gammaproteobacteria bacterium]
MAQYLDLIRHWNTAYSLVSSYDVLHRLHDHVTDSLSLLPYLPKIDSHLDIGSGGGFPGIPIAIYRPLQKIVLNDRSRNKCRFLREVKSHLKLHNVIVVEQDVREPNPAGTRFKSITIRSVARPTQAWLLARSHLHEDGSVFLQTSVELSDGDLENGRIDKVYQTERGLIIKVGLVN